MLAHQVPILVVGGVDHPAVLRRQVMIQSLFVEGTRFPIHRHHEGFEAQGFHVLPVVPGDVGSDLVHPVGSFEHGL